MAAKKWDCLQLDAVGVQALSVKHLSVGSKQLAPNFVVLLPFDGTGKWKILRNMKKKKKAQRKFIKLYDFNGLIFKLYDFNGLLRIAGSTVT